MNLLKFLFDIQASPEDRWTFWHMLSDRPLIFYLQSPRKPLIFVHRALAKKRAYLLRGPIGCEEHAKYSRRWRRYFVLARRVYPEHTVTFLCNTPSSADTFGRAGLPSVFFNQNSLLDERIYRVMRDVPKEFDAVYNAQMEKVKRHSLAARIRSLALITYRVDSQPGYYRRMRKELGHASWLNFEAGQWKWLPDSQVAFHLNRARVGLILSEAEGANYATVEYLLCGLPVVSTRSSGGRSEFFDEDYVKVVDATPQAVADGVSELIGRRIDPDYIRGKTIERMQAHREVFIALLQRICDAEGIRRAMREEWPSLFFNKLLAWRSLGELKELARAVQPDP